MTEGWSGRERTGERGGELKMVEVGGGGLKHVAIRRSWSAEKR